MTRLLVSLAFAAYLFDPCEPTAVVYPLARGLWFLCALVLLPLLGSTVEAQRAYLLELGAGVHRQSFDEATGVKRVRQAGPSRALASPLSRSSSKGRSGKPEAPTPERTRRQHQHPDNHRLGAVQHSHRPERVGAPEAGWRLESTVDAASRGLISAAAAPSWPGAGLRMGITPDLLARGDLTLTRNDSNSLTCPSPTSGLAWASATCWEARRSPTATATASSRTRTAAPTLRPAPRWTGQVARATATPTAC